VSRGSAGPTVTVRGQSNLVAVAAALLAVTAATALGLAMADLAMTGADRPVEDRRVATSLSERFVAPSSPLAARGRVLNETALSRLTACVLRAAFPVVGDRPVRIRVGGRTVVERGDPQGQTVRRVVLVQRRRSVTVTPRLDGDDVTLPRRTPLVRLRIDPPDGVRVTAARVGDRVVLRNASGLSGTFTVRTSRYRNATLSFAANGSLPRGSVRATYFPARTTKAVLEVTVGAD
jgi:hypothetical protein